MPKIKIQIKQKHLKLRDLVFIICNEILLKKFLHLVGNSRIILSSSIIDTIYKNVYISTSNRWKGIPDFIIYTVEIMVYVMVLGGAK